MDAVNKYLKEHAKASPLRNGFRDAAPRIVCMDGFSMSVQASKYHYSLPRETDAFPYSSVEIGFPSRRIPEANEYAEEPKRHTKTVFGFVPVKIVNEIIRKHGGIKAQETRATA